MSFLPISDPSPSLGSAFVAPTPRPPVARMCAWADSCVGGKIRLGCSIPMAPPVDVCIEIGCNSQFHHCCQTEWEMAQYRHDFPDGDPGDCKYESRGKYCLKHHPNGEYAIITTVDMNEEKKSTTKATRETAASRKKKDMIDFVSKQRIDNIVLNSDNTDVESVGGVSWTKLTVDAKREFAKVNNISVPQTMRTGADLGKVVANWINSSGYRDMIAAVVKKKAPGSTAAATKPTCITIESTLFRVINTIVACKVAFMATKAANDRDDQDSHKPKQVAWETMANYYNDISNTDLDIISPDAVNDLVGCDVPVDYPARFDILNYDEIKEVSAYINVHYRKARNAKTQKSGSHGGISAHCQGKIWLMYYDALLRVDGNMELDSFAFPQLPADIIRTSTSHVTPLMRRGGRTDRRSETPIGMSSFSRSLSASSRETASSATVSAMAAMESRLDSLKETENYTRESKMTADLFQIKTDVMKMTREYIKLGRKYKSAKALGNCNDMVEDLKVERNMVKKQVRMYTKQYNILKEKLGYESASCSSASSDDEDNISKDDDDSE